MRSQLETTPPYSGADMVADANDAFQTIATDFAGPTDPAAMAWPYATWADTGNMLLKRRNAADTDWVVIGPLFDYHYTRGNILGTVSETSGVPTGALLEYGSNANGEYWRFASGLQICANEVSLTVAQNTNWAGSIMFTTGAQSLGSWPAEFASNTLVKRFFACRDGTYSIIASGAGTTNTVVGAVQIISQVSRGSTEFTVHVFGVGRWYEA